MTVKGKNVLVTGAGGFTGSHLCKSLMKKGANVVAYVKRGSPLSNLDGIIDKIQIVKGDIQDYTNLFATMKNNKIDFVFHVAAIVPVHESRELPYLSTQVNTVGTFNVAWSAIQAGVKKLLYTSTCHVYGNQSKLPINEESIPNPLDIYSATKYAGEILLKQFVNVNGIEIIITRAFNKYGPNQVGDWLFPRTIKKVFTQNKITVGNPDSTRDYTYVDDAVEGYILAMEKGKNGDLFNLGSGKETSVKQIVEKIIDISGRKISVEWETFRKVDINRSFADCTKAKNILGWEPKISLDKGIKKTIEWWNQHPELTK